MRCSIHGIIRSLDLFELQFYWRLYSTQTWLFFLFALLCFTSWGGGRFTILLISTPLSSALSLVTYNRRLDLRPNEIIHLTPKADSSFSLSAIFLSANPHTPFKSTCQIQKLLFQSKKFYCAFGEKHITNPLTIWFYWCYNLYQFVGDFWENCENCVVFLQQPYFLIVF